MSVKSGAEVGVGVEVSLFFYCNAVLGLGLGSGLTLALTLRLNNPNLTLTLTLTLKQHSLKKDRPRPRTRVLRALAWYSQSSLNGHLVLVPAVFSHFTVTLYSLKRTPLRRTTVAFETVNGQLESAFCIPASGNVSALRDSKLKFLICCARFRPRSRHSLLVMNL